ncbi:hypothetical protein NU688_32750 [Variovorax sp. ZS18.2.2]|uniref:hypothetical protein n=1 Tax=Variovorax sp. ZS18.2.2 TaxID=2971255 RepID=UPI002151F9AD|nr:hypothetical protein [Variovorax sp. ZS18.2.2]MCR6480966.1 hypothetical protein [Variovorax sp. ZS18.2.2]
MNTPTTSAEVLFQRSHARKLKASKRITPARKLTRSSPSERDEQALNEAVLLNWLGQQPVVYHRIYVDITGGVVAAVWLSHVIDRLPMIGRDSQVTSGMSADPGNADFDLSDSDCEEATGISAEQQVLCRKLLAARGLLSERVAFDRASSGKAIHGCYTIHMSKLSELLRDASRPLAEAMLGHVAKVAGVGALLRAA